MLTNPPENPIDLRDDQSIAWMRRILEEEMRQTQQLNKIARAAQLWFWLTIIGLILGVCGPLTVALLTMLGVIGSLQIPNF